MIGFYNYTVILTYMGMLSGFAGITLAMNGRTDIALFCLIAAGICDMFDGKVASTMERTRQEKRFGVQIDSLSDLICFGVLPAVIIVQICGHSIPSCFIAAIYTLSALIRLAWFNVDEEERQRKEEGKRVYYLGLPVTAAAAFVPSFIWLADKYVAGSEKYYPLLLMVIAAAFLTPFRIKRPSFRKLGMILCGGAAVVLFFAAGMDV